MVSTGQHLVLFLALSLLLQSPALGVSPRVESADPGKGHPADPPHDQHSTCPSAEALSSVETTTGLPQLLGQDAFAALAEMRHLLESEATTDWSRVDLDALRNHLVDMNRVLLFADSSVLPVPGGFEAKITGKGRTLEAILRMLPAHARFSDGRDSMQVRVRPLSSGEGAEKTGLAVTVTTTDPANVPRLRGLGFFGFLTGGDHHRFHHRAMATGGGHP